MTVPGMYQDLAADMINRLPASRLLADTGPEATMQGISQGAATIARNNGDSRASAAAAAQAGPSRAEVQREVEAALAEVLGSSLGPEEPLMSGE